MRTSLHPRRRTSRWRADQYCPRWVSTIMVFLSLLACRWPADETGPTYSSLMPMAKPKASSRRKTAEGGTALAGPLLEWYARKRRDLPWREDPTPYRVWISEVMLQQTRVEVVIPRYQRFLRRFPTLESLAAASEAEVLSEWSGLGYYRRARALHSAARVVMRDHGGRFPRELAAARSLPGVGPYTAGAILSIAYNLPVPILDGNVER